MKLTPEQLKQNAAAMIAFADGKPIEVESKDARGWILFDALTPDWNCWEFRPVTWQLPPPPKTRAWTFEEAPTTTLKLKHKKLGSLATADVWPDGFMVAYGMKSSTESFTFEALFNHFVQLDGTPCGVTE